MPTILDLASETILDILLQLDVRDILVCKQICGRFRELAESSVVQYKCHLAKFAGAVDGSAGSSSVAERLHALKEYQLAWKTLSLSFDPSLSSTGRPDRTYPFRHLTFSGPLVAMHVGTKLRLYRPASPGRQAKAMRWTLDLAHIGLTPFMGASDLGENVVAICGANIVHGRFCCHFLTLLPDGTMTPHPFALQTPPEIPSIHHPRSVTQIVIQGNLFLLMTATRMRGSALYVLNWKTGIILPYMEKIYSPMVFHMLSENLVLVSYQEELAIHRLEPASSQTPVYGGPPLCMLRPPPHAGFYVKDIPHQPLSSLTGNEGLFRSDPEAALLVIHFGFRSEPGGTPLDYVLCIPRATLVARLALSAASVAGPPAGAVRMLDWEDWTRGGTLLHFSRFTFVELQVATFGSRVAVMSHRVQFDRRLSEAPTDVCVFEIHPWARASNIHPRVSGDGLEDLDFTAESEGTIAPLEDSLPFYVSHRAVAQEDDAPQALLDKEYILLLEDGVALLREEVLGDGEMRTTTHCYLSTA